MALLRLLTLIYAGVLVAALAVVLITIMFYLWRVAGALADARAALVLVRERTAPLRQHLQGLEELTIEHVQQVEEATTTIEQALERLTAPATAEAGAR
jgi:hypothetical protein